MGRCEEGAEKVSGVGENGGEERMGLRVLNSVSIIGCCQHDLGWVSRDRVSRLLSLLESFP